MITHDLEINSETDLYGYSKWLSENLGYKIIPRSLRGFQHGWIWWDSDVAPIKRNYGLDPNLSSYWGILAQDEKLSLHLQQNEGIYAIPAGLPFLNFYNHSGLKGKYKNKSNKSNVLFIPGHSNPWNNTTQEIFDSIKSALLKYGNMTILIGGSDIEIAKALETIGIEYIIGAHIYDSRSFHRLTRAFESHDYVISSCMGSHICYALHCGAKIGIDVSLYQQYLEKIIEAETIDNKRIQEMGLSLSNIMSLEVIDSLFPGIFMDHNSTPNYNTIPTISDMPPVQIADNLGWNVTYKSDMHHKYTPSNST